MKKIKEYEFGKDFYVYYKEKNFNEYSCVGFEYYQQNKEEFAGKELIIAHKDVPVYFRLA